MAPVASRKAFGTFGIFLWMYRHLYRYTKIFNQWNVKNGYWVTERLSDWQSEDLKDLQELLSATKKRFTRSPLALVTTIGLCQFLQFICVERREKNFIDKVPHEVKITQPPGGGEGFVTENISQNNWIIILWVQSANCSILHSNN